MASTFKPNSSLSSTDEINKKKDYKGLKSESEFLEASSHLTEQIFLTASNPKWSWLCQQKNSILASQINKYTWFSYEIHLVNVCAHEGNGLRKPIWKTTEPWNPIFSRISPTTWDWEGAHVHIGSQSQLTQRKTLLPRESKWSNNSV